MSNNNNERRELTAAELDLVSGGSLENTLVSSYVVSSGYSSFSWSEHQTGTAVYDVRQNRTA